MDPLLSNYGVRFSVRNAGETGSCGDNADNQVWCMRHMVGDDVDAIHYSWTYHEQMHQTLYKEAFIRWALKMPHFPIPTILDVLCHMDVWANRE